MEKQEYTRTIRMFEKEFEKEGKNIYKMETDNRALRSKIEELEQKNTNTHSLQRIEQLTAIDEQAQSENAENRKLRSTIEELENIVDAQRNESNKYFKKIEELTQKQQAMKIKMENLSSTNNKLKSKFVDQFIHSEINTAIDLFKKKKLKNKEMMTAVENEMEAKNDRSSLSEIAAELRNLQDRILDAKKELSDGTDHGKYLSRSSSSPLSVELSEADKECSLGMDLEMQDSTFEIQNLVHSISATIEDLREEIIKSKDRVEMAHSSCNNTMDQENVDKVSQLNDEVNVLNQRLQDEGIKSRTLESTERILKLKDENEGLLKDLKVKNAAVTAMKTSSEITTGLENKLKVKEHTVIELQERVRVLTEENRKFRKQLKEKCMKIASLESALTAKRKSEKKSAENVTKLEQTSKHLKESMEHLTSEKDKIFKQLQENTNYSEKWEEKEKKLQDTIQELKERTLGLRAEKEEMKTKMENLTSTNNKLKSKFVDQFIHSEINTAIDLFKNKKLKNKEMMTALENEMETKNDRSSLSEIAAELRNLQDRILDAKKELSDGTDHGKYLSRSSSSPLSVELSEADKECSLGMDLEMQDSTFEIQNLVHSISATIEDLREEIIKSKDRIEMAHSSCSNTMDQENVDKVSQLNDEVNVLNQRLQDEEIKFKTLESALNEQNELNNNKQREVIEQLQSDLSFIQDELERSKSCKDSQCNVLKQDLDLKAAQCDKLKDELQNIRDENNTLNDLIQSSRCKASVNEEKVSELQEYIGELEAENQRLLDKLVKQRNELHSIHHSQENQLQTMVDNLEDEIKDLQSELKVDSKEKWDEQEKKLQDTIQELKERTLILTAEKEVLDKEYKENTAFLDNKIMDLKQKITDQMVSETKWSKDMKYLENKIEVFADRTLRLTKENKRVAEQFKENATSSECKIAELQDKLTDMMDSELNLLDTVKDWKDKLEFLTDRTHTLTKENERLLKQLKECESQLKYRKDYEQDLSEKPTLRGVPRWGWGDKFVRQGREGGGTEEEGGTEEGLRRD
ncbi:hypothetical protein QZH41_015665 [Actinostola sp. cb2023]|nr:hypothetical protein QZH41_015665 [Actinostola sp. cb2023]